jgi:hypothetical protein
MFVIAKTSTQLMRALVPGQTIFLRPTPWKVAWQAWFDYLRSAGRFCFVYLPHEFSNPAFDYRLERAKDLAVFQDGKEIARLPLLPLTFVHWLFYVIESYAYGFMARFWLWTWDSPRPSRAELETKIEQLERRLSELVGQQDEDES